MDSFFHIQGAPASPLAPLILIHAVSGFALPYLSLGPLSSSTDPQHARPVYGLSCPIYESRSYHPPKSFIAVARQYVNRIREELPHGPYILGGWSMGGMIAIKMVEILEKEGEEVLEVLLIDSTNPEGYPAFNDTRERDEVAEWTYKAYAGRSGLPGLEEMGCEEESVLSKEEDRDSGLGDEDDDEVDVTEYLPRMRKHIYNSLDLIAWAGQGDYMPKKINSPVTLVKCTELATLPETMSQGRKNAIRHRFQDERAGWTMEKLQSIPVDARHDDVFDSQHVGKVTGILRGVLEEMK
ncbi:MAG: hypothetical protein ASARMPRED_000210 [Alectoria sarmentosa]|nr:MAG: hypothetical protein ASARMPRED_000210 [Alectoria sarmentosa]